MCSRRRFNTGGKQEILHRSTFLNSFLTILVNSEGNLPPISTKASSVIKTSSYALRWCLIPRKKLGDRRLHLWRKVGVHLQPRCARPPHVQMLRRWVRTCLISQGKANLNLSLTTERHLKNLAMQASRDCPKGSGVFGIV